MRKMKEKIRTSSVIALCVLTAYVMLLVLSPALTFATPPQQRGRPTRVMPTRSAGISLSPREGVPGTAGVRVEGMFFAPNHPCQVRWDNPDVQLLGDVSTDSEGNFYVNINIPHEAGAGQHTVTAICNTSATALFWVVAPTVTTTPEVVPTEAPSDTPEPTETKPTTTPSPTWLAVTPIYPTAQGPVGAVAVTPGAVSGGAVTPVKGATTVGGRATATLVVRATATPVRPAGSIEVPTVGWGIAPLLGGLLLASIAILVRIVRIGGK